MGLELLLRPVSVFGVAVLACGLAAGCSVHPLPDDVSRTSSYDIVKRVRCEVNEALAEFEPKERARVDRIVAVSTIGYDFTFDITEGNNLDDNDKKGIAQAIFGRPSHAGSEKGFILDLSARAETKRVNKRTFRIIESLSEAADKSTDCTNVTTHANLAYPITGATGMGEVVRTYIRLEMLTDFPRGGSGKVPDEEFKIPGKNVVFSDVLTFTTEVSVGVKPSLVLRSVAGDFRLTNASLFGSAERRDVHKVIVALASNPGDDPDTVPGDAKQRNGTGQGTGKRSAPKIDPRAAVAKVERKALLKSELLRDTRTTTAVVQKDLDARNRVLFELQRLRDLEDDANEAPRRLGERLLQLLREPD